MDSMFDSCVNFEPPFQELQNYALVSADGKVALLGKQFEAASDLSKICDYVTSRLWFTYRRGFQPIGGTGPSSDQGWGCMLRCAQMLLGEVLLRRHIGEHYHWKREKPSGDYEKILNMFLDEKAALYSIHQIAQMGVSEGKQVGEWFGPNTAAQVLKKLCVFDQWSGLAVHVALDNILIRDDVRTIATTNPPKDAVKLIVEDGRLGDHFLNRSWSAEFDETLNQDMTWRPLLLVIPLRLGLTGINRCYLPAIKKYFELPQCTGIMGGRPNHALFFVGITGDRLIYLDPHICQLSLSAQPGQGRSEAYFDGFEAVETTEVSDEKSLDDSTYHCPNPLAMPYDQVDPSLALTFFCKTEADFEALSRELDEELLPSTKPSLFEQLQSRPSYWPPFEPYLGVRGNVEMKEFHDMGDPNFDSDEEFEVLQ